MYARTIPAPIVDHPPHARWSGGGLLLPVVLLCAALAVRLYGIGHESLWIDEGYTFLFSGLPIKQLLLIGGAHEHPPLYYLLVHVLLTAHLPFLAGRVISALAGTLAVGALFGLGRHLGGKLLGGIAALLLLVSPFHTWFSQDARAYEMAGLFVVLSYWMGLRAVQATSRRGWIAYGVCTVLALYSEYTTLFVLIPQILLLVQAHQSGRARHLVASWMLTLLLYLPWMGMLIHDATGVVTDYWLPSPNGDMVSNTFLQFLGLRAPCPAFPCVGSQAAVPLLAGHESLVAMGAAIAVCGVLLAAIYLRNVIWTMMSLWLVIPFGFVLLIALRRPLYIDRVFLDATFPLYLLMAAGVTRLRHLFLKALASLACVAVTVSSVLNLTSVYAQTLNPDWKSLSRDLHSALRPQQAIVYNPAVLRTLVRSYQPAGWGHVHETVLWSHNYLDLPGWQQQYAGLHRRVLADPHILPALRQGVFDTLLRDRQLVSDTRGRSEVWLVTQDYSGVADTRRWFVARGYHLLLSEIYGGDARLELYSRNQPQLFGSQLLSPAGFVTGARKTGHTARRTGSLLMTGTSMAQRSFSIRGGRAYTINVEWRAEPGSHPEVRLWTYDHRGHVQGKIVDRFGNLLDYFPRTEWYTMPANGVWIGQPFGFVAPPGTVMATLQLRNQGAACRWRNIGIYGNT